MSDRAPDLGDLLAALPIARLPSPRPQPIHTVYGGAHLFREDTREKVGRLALEHLWRHGKDPGSFARVLGLPPALAEAVWDRTVANLERRAVQDYRIDFEDGFGPRPDAEEDRAAIAAAAALSACDDPGPTGIRIRALSTATGARALRTLRLFLEHLSRRPPGFVVTLPKPSDPREVEVLVRALERLEGGERVAVELMVETPGALRRLRELVEAADGRCVAVHLGAYDLTGAAGVPASDQALDHPLCDHARSAMQVALADIDVHLVDGATTTLPVGPHRASGNRAGEALSREQLAENDRVVHDAWRLHARNVRRALAQGFRQGWDLHPGQIPVRHGALAAWTLSELPAMTARMRAFLDAESRAIRTGATFDDAATGIGLRNWFRAARELGFVGAAELQAAGLEPPARRSHPPLSGA